MEIIDDEDVKQYFKNTVFERKTITHNGQEVEALQYRSTETAPYNVVAGRSGITSPDVPGVWMLVSPGNMYPLTKGDTVTLFISWFDLNE